MIRVITKDKTEVKVYNYHKYQTLNCDSDGKETFEATYHLYLNKKDAQKFSVNEKVEVAFLGEDWKVKSISYLEKDLYCVELTHKDTTVKDDTPVTPEDCKLDNDCDRDCCNCEKENKAPVKEEGKSVDSIDSMLKKILSQEDLDKLPKHLVCIFSDGNKDTVAFEMEKGNMKGIGIAKRHKKDKFDFYTGAQLAFNRCVGADSCTCDGCHCEDDVIWLHEDDDEPLMDSCGRPLKFGDFVVGHKDGGYYPGVIGRSNNQYYLCYQDKVATPIEEFTDFDLVYRG